MNTVDIAAQLHKNYQQCLQRGIQPTTERLIKGIKAPKETIMRVISKEFREIEQGCEPGCVEATV